MRSVLRVGHSLALYCYDRPVGVPAGIELRDAARILPRSAMFRHLNGSLAIFADWFRYELQRRSCGTWIDLDMYLVAPLDGERPYLFGEQEPGIINNAVLRVPPDSPLLPPLLGLFEQPTSPPWLSPRETAEAWARRLLTGRIDVATLPWGTTGPRALAFLASRFGLGRWALPADVFYPVPWQRAGWIRDPAVPLDEVISERTVGVHLWNEQIRQLDLSVPAPNSFLARLCREGANK